MEPSDGVYLASLGLVLSQSARMGRSMLVATPSTMMEQRNGDFPLDISIALGEMVPSIFRGTACTLSTQTALYNGQFTIGGSGGHCITTDCSVTSYVTIQQSSVAIGSNGILYFGSGVTDSTCSVSGCTRYGAGNLYAMAPNGTLSWKFAVGSTAGLYFSVSDPAIGSNGTIYVGSSDGNLYAIG